MKLGYHKQTGFKVAIKIIDKEALEGNKDRKRKMEREIAILVRILMYTVHDIIIRLVKLILYNKFKNDFIEFHS